MPFAMSVAFAGVLGGILGSFFNVVAYRLPRSLSLVSPGSACPACATAIKPYDNVPVLGWLWLRGRCRSCAEPISPRYPIVELMTAALAVATVALVHPLSRVVLGLVLLAVLVPVALIDLDRGIIPNRITGLGAAAALVAGLAVRPSGVLEQLVAGAAAAGFLLAFVLAYPRGMGMGDVKLAGVLGLLLGRYVAIGIMAGVLIGTVVGLVVMWRVGVERGRKTKVPFGPSLAAGALVALFAGPTLMHLWLG